MAKLKDKVAIVTGASKGIGAEIARHFAREGASVVVNYSSSKSAADTVVKEIEKTGARALAVKADISKSSDIELLFKETQNAFGRLDILVNNAGVYRAGPIESVTAEIFHRHFDLNVLGLLLCTKESLKYFGEDGGSIINISSVASTAAPANLSVYSATKAAVDAITRSLSKELGPRKIRVNAINPGLIETEGVHEAGFPDGFREWIQSETPLGRIGLPDDVSPTAVFLASSDSKWITGEHWTITGGFR
jgi:3-oxoacyl-[acyl-carrier protein] reductase